MSRWIKFVELSTKLVSLTPFLIGVAYSLYRNNTLDFLATGILFVAVLFWSLTVTMINNYIDRRREGKELHFSKAVSLALIYVTGGAAMLLGLWLSYLYGLPVLFAGAISFGVGILYSFTPISISRTPYGEIASGLTEGFLVIFLTVFVNAHTGSVQYADLQISGRVISASMDWVSMLALLLLALPNMCCTSNIMLSNNICDVERDVQSKRYTLPYYIGQKHALRLYGALYVAAYAAIAVSVIAGVLAPLSLLALLTAPLVYRNVKAFVKKPVKAETFILSVKNYTILLYGYLLTILAGYLVSLL
ncbi:MAG TPA: UbiA family prenyltransferase [Candidatus Limiplasma sp.]|nr:UbiA family prenyltransferase [Candidatus Limiplasma sp.]HRX09243.1 UbiA family prenyltransferase [Candidatus Limiplasma sp.]